MSITEACVRKLKNLREFNNYTQSYVADKLDMSQNAYSLLEKGATKITLDRLEELAKLYKISIIELVSESTLDLNAIGKESNGAFHSNYPPHLSIMEKRMYEQTITRLEGNIEKLYALIAQLTQKISLPQE